MTFEDLTAWARRVGIHIEAIHPQSCSGSQRGFFADRDIDAGTAIARVPQEVLLTCNGPSTPSLAGLTSTQRLALCLLRELQLGSASMWQPYLAQLPATEHRLAAFSKDELNSLQVRYAKETGSDAAECLQQEWHTACNAMAGTGITPSLQSLQSWQWASAMVASRTMHFPSGGSAGALVPFADLFNHAPGRQPSTPFIKGFLEGGSCSDEHANDGQGNDELEDDIFGSAGHGDFDVESKQYCIYSGRRYRKGQQVFLTYGHHTNLQLLEQYGFVLMDNPDDQAMLPLLAFGLPSLAEHVQPKDAWLHWNGVPSWTLLHGLRLATASHSERRKAGHLAAAGRRMSTAAEVRAMVCLQAACECALSVLPTTIQQDQTLLRGSLPSEKHRLAIQWRVCYKGTLHRAVLGAKKAQTHLSNEV